MRISYDHQTVRLCFFPFIKVFRYGDLPDFYGSSSQKGPLPGGLLFPLDDHRCRLSPKGIPYQYSACKNVPRRSYLQHFSGCPDPFRLLHDPLCFNSSFRLFEKILFHQGVLCPFPDLRLYSVWLDPPSGSSLGFLGYFPSCHPETMLRSSFLLS